MRIEINDKSKRDFKQLSSLYLKITNNLIQHYQYPTDTPPGAINPWGTTPIGATPETP
jgi:hypothetical protein